MGPVAWTYVDDHGVSRLILTEGLITVALGVAVYFLLPNCRCQRATPKWSVY